MCHNNPSLLEPSKNAQNTTRSKKSLLQYNFNHGSTSTKKHMLNKHLDKFVMYKFESKSTNGGEGGGERARRHARREMCGDTIRPSSSSQSASKSSSSSTIHFLETCSPLTRVSFSFDFLKIVLSSKTHMIMSIWMESPFLF